MVENGSELQEMIFKQKKAIGLRLREYRKSAGLTQEEMAKALQVSANYLGDLERGAKVISINLVLCFFLVFDCNKDTQYYFLFGEKRQKQPRKYAHPVFEKVAAQDDAWKNHLFALMTRQYLKEGNKI